VPLSQRALIVGSAVFLMLVIFELVRKRRLREEYSWLWLLLGLGVLGVSFLPFTWMKALAAQLGSETPTAIIYFMGFLALILISLQFSVRLSKMTEQIKNLGQQVALLEAERDELRAKAEPDPPEA
jgi:hypothetical protein